MEKKSLNSTAKKRSKSATSTQSLRKSHRKGTKKSNHDGTASKAKYSQLDDEDEGIEMSDLDLMKPVETFKAAKNPDAWRPHEIYENTQYQPNKYLRLLEIPIHSSLSFQRLLFYHASFDLIYFMLMVAGQLHRL